MKDMRGWLPQPRPRVGKYIWAGAVGGWGALARASWPQKGTPRPSSTTCPWFYPSWTEIRLGLFVKTAGLNRTRSCDRGPWTLLALTREDPERVSVALPFYLLFINTCQPTLKRSSLKRKEMVWWTAFLKQKLARSAPSRTGAHSHTTPSGARAQSCFCSQWSQADRFRAKGRVLPSLLKLLFDR